MAVYEGGIHRGQTDRYLERLACLSARNTFGIVLAIMHVYLGCDFCLLQQRGIGSRCSLMKCRLQQCCLSHKPRRGDKSIKLDIKYFLVLIFVPKQRGYGSGAVVRERGMGTTTGLLKCTALLGATKNEGPALHCRNY